MKKYVGNRYLMASVVPEDVGRVFIDHTGRRAKLLRIDVTDEGNIPFAALFKKDGSLINKTFRLYKINGWTVEV